MWGAGEGGGEEFQPSGGGWGRVGGKSSSRRRGVGVEKRRSPGGRDGRRGGEGWRREGRRGERGGEEKVAGGRDRRRVEKRRPLGGKRSPTGGEEIVDTVTATTESD